MGSHGIGSAHLSWPIGGVFGASLAGIALLVSLAGCDTKKAEAPAPCCEQPTIPAGVTPFKVVADDVTGPSDGQKVLMRVALEKPAKRDALYPVLHTLYRHAMQRTAFEPIHFVADVYASEGAAASGSDSQIIARISREQSQVAPRCDNRVPYDFSEQVERAWNASLGGAPEENSDDSCHLSPVKQAARFDAQFKHKPSYQVDPANKSVSVTYPYLEMGKDEYVPVLKLASALTQWTEFVTSLFNKVADLKAVTYTGLHNDAPVIKITVNRQQFDGTFSRVQETIASHAALTFQTVGMGKTSDKAAVKEQETFKLKVYKNALSDLPKNQVTISPQLLKASK